MERAFSLLGRGFSPDIPWASSSEDLQGGCLMVFMSDWKIARMKLKFNGIEFPALDLLEVELRTLQLDNKIVLKVKTASKGIIEMSCAANDNNSAADFQKAHEHFAYILETGNEYRRIHRSN